MKIEYIDREIADEDLIHFVKSKTFGKIIFNKESLSRRFYKSLDDRFEMPSNKNVMIGDDEIHIKWTSNIVYKDLDLQKLFLDKLYHCSIPFMWGTTDSYVFKGTNKEFNSFKQIPSRIDDCLLNIENISSFQNFIDYDIDTRFFNEILKSSDKYIKKSKNIEKIKAEYSFLSSVPKDFKQFYIPVSSFKETNEDAQYSMPKLNYLDMAKRHINGKMSEGEILTFFKFLDTYLNKIKKDTFKKTGNEFSFIFEKTIERYEEFQNKDFFHTINSYFKNSTKYENLNSVFEYLLDSLESNKDQINKSGSIISHGDLCFSNILTSKYYDHLIFIDPRGGDFEKSHKSIYYDFAKLSHSILGNYDFILNELANLRLNKDLELKIIFKVKENKILSKNFITFIEKYGLSYKILRLIEASLFMSMIPLHSENHKKVLMFAIRGSEILEEYKSSN